MLKVCVAIVIINMEELRSLGFVAMKNYMPVKIPHLFYFFRRIMLKLLYQ